MFESTPNIQHELLKPFPFQSHFLYIWADIKRPFPMANKRTTQTGIPKPGKPSDVKSPSLNTVRVPDPIRPIFEKAQQYVSKYFSERLEDPQHSSIKISGERYILVRAASMSVEFVDLVASLYKDRGKKEAQALAYDLLFDVAHAIGKADARAFSLKMGVTDP